MPFLAAVIGVATVATVGTQIWSAVEQKSQAAETIENQQDATLTGARISVVQPLAEGVSALG